MIDAVTFDVGGTLADGGLQKNRLRKGITTYLRSLGYAITEREYREAANLAMKDLVKVRKKCLEMKFEDFYSKILSQLGIIPSSKILNEIWSIYCDSFSFVEKEGARMS